MQTIIGLCLQIKPIVRREGPANRSCSSGRIWRASHESVYALQELCGWVIPHVGDVFRFLSARLYHRSRLSQRGWPGQQGDRHDALWVGMLVMAIDIRGRRSARDRHHWTDQGIRFLVRRAWNLDVGVMLATGLLVTEIVCWLK